MHATWIGASRLPNIIYSTMQPQVILLLFWRAALKDIAEGIPFASEHAYVLFTM